VDPNQKSLRDLLRGLTSTRLCHRQYIWERDLALFVHLKICCGEYQDLRIRLFQDF
jgi:hypothetical protein